MLPILAFRCAFSYTLCVEPGLLLPFFLVSVCAGVLGSMLGLGGGIIIVPALTLLFGQDIHYAIGASIVSVIATSTSAAAVYLRYGYVNVRLGLLLGLPTIIGAPIGGFLGIWLARRPLEGLFGCMLLYTAHSMVRAAIRGSIAAEPPEDLANHPHAASFFDHATGEEQSYLPKRVHAGAGASLGAGLVSGLLGVGGGFINVPAMHLIMGIPLKAAIATSNYMIGITGAASAMIYYAHGFVKPMIVAPCAIGVLLGAQLGSRLAARVHSSVLRWVFVALLVFLAAEMFYRAFGSGR